MPVYQNKNKATKKGHSWYFSANYKTSLGEHKKYNSKMYATKREAIQAEMEYLSSLSTAVQDRTLTLEQLFYNYKAFQKDKVKESSYGNYNSKFDRFKLIAGVKLGNLNYHHYELWRKEIDKTSLSTIYKNDLNKFFKALLNYAQKYLNFECNSLLLKITSFKDPDAIKNEMEYYTHEEFKLFIASETEQLYIVLFKVLYYCGLRKGEARGLTWEDINFAAKTLTVNKQINSHCGLSNWKFTSPKTKSSYRTLPLSDEVLKELKLLKEQYQAYSNYSNTWLVFGGSLPFTTSSLATRNARLRKSSNVKRIRVHDFRHSCASLLINNGANITLVAKYLGHSKVDQTLNTYAHMYKSSLDELIDSINKIQKIRM